MSILGHGGWSRPTHPAPSTGHVQRSARSVDNLPLCPSLKSSGGHVQFSAKSGYFGQEFKSLFRTLGGSCFLKVVGGLHQVVPGFGPVSQSGVRPAQKKIHLAQYLR